MKRAAFSAAALISAVCVLYACGGRTSETLPQTSAAPAGVRAALSTTTGTITVGGPIVAVSGSTAFQIQAGSACGYLWIHTTSSTVFVPSGARPAVGLNAQVTGTGSCATSVTATQVTLGSDPVPKHVLTAAYLYASPPDFTTSHGRVFSAYASTLTWAQTFSGSAVAATGIKTMLYTNPNRIRPTEPMYTSDESTFAHTCSNTRITTTGTTNDYFMNPLSTDMVSLYKSYVSNELSTQHFDAIFDDGPYDFYALTAMPCNFNPTTWLNAYINEMKAIGHPVLYNGLGNFGANNTLSPSIQVNPGAIGGMAEGCYAAEWHPFLSPGETWILFENTEITMAQQNKIFICYANDISTASTAIASRLYAYASFLMTYNVQTSVLWEYYGTTSGYTVEPESKLVALSPVVATPSSVTSLRTATGVYGRQYHACYIGGTSVGKCAVVVNPDPSNSHAFPYTGYHHTLALTGGGILDGGTVSSQGPAPPSSLAPLTAAIAFQ